MAQRKRTEAPEVGGVAESAGDVSISPFDESEWETIERESATKVEFDTVGDVFVGQFIEVQKVAPENGKEPFDLLIFGRDGEIYSITPSFKLQNAMGNLMPGDWVRITYVGDVQTGNGLNPMKNFRVERRTTPN